MHLALFHSYSALVEHLKLWSWRVGSYDNSVVCQRTVHHSINWYCLPREKPLAVVFSDAKMAFSHSLRSTAGTSLVPWVPIQLPLPLWEWLSRAVVCRFWHSFVLRLCRMFSRCSTLSAADLGGLFWETRYLHSRYTHSWQTNAPHLRVVSTQR